MVYDIVLPTWLSLFNIICLRDVIWTPHGYLVLESSHFKMSNTAILWSWLQHQILGGAVRGQPQNLWETPENYKMKIIRDDFIIQNILETLFLEWSSCSQIAILFRGANIISWHLMDELGRPREGRSMKGWHKNKAEARECYDLV